MKTKLFRIFGLLFVLSSVLNLVISQPTYADPESDAIKIITECKAKNGPFASDSTCDLYTKCINRTFDTAQCPSIKKLNDTIPGFNPAMSAGCQSKDHSYQECKEAFDTCLRNHLKEDKLAGGDADKCKAAITKGDLAAAKKAPDPGEEKTTCVIDGVGWLVCPVMTFLALVVDGAYAFVSSLLTVQPLLTNTSDPNNSIYVAWSMMRNFANVAFVIAFLVIIFSQVSSVGITNYGIKKMLPRLVVAAVLVNISYWLCAIAVDVSNILGTSTNDLFKSIKAALQVPDAGNFGEGTGWQGITGVILAGGVAVALIYVNLSALLPALVMVLFAIVVVFLVLTLRQALIILLIVIAPLAFVAYLLPNTESLFKKWKDLLQTLLLMYPIIALIFGASALASKVVMASAEGTYKIPIQIMGAMISIIPLALTPLVMKTAGGVLNRFGGIINNPNKGPADRLRKRAEGFRDFRGDVNKAKRLKRGEGLLEGEGGKLGGQHSRRRRVAASLASIGNTNAVNKAQRDNFAKVIGEETAQGYFANRALNEEGFAERIAGDPKKAESIQASAQSAVDKILKQDVASRKVLLRADVEIMNNPQEAFEKALREGDKVQALAAQELLFESGSGGISKFRNAIQKVEKESGSAANYGAVREDLQRNIVESHGQYAKQKGADVVAWARGGDKQLSDTTAPPLSNSELAGQHSGSLQKMASSGVIDPDQAKRTLADPQAQTNLDPEKRRILGQVADVEVRSLEPTQGQLDIAHGEAVAEERSRNRRSGP